MAMLKTTSSTILCVEDITYFAARLHSNLRPVYQVDIAIGATIARKKLIDKRYQAVVLGSTLSDEGAAKLCQYIHEEHPKVHILCMVSTAQRSRALELLNAGADNYSFIPFDPNDTKAKLRAMLRRNTAVNTTILRCGDLYIDTGRRIVCRGDTMINVRPKEYLLLERLLQTPEQVVSRHALSHYAWGSLTDWNVSIDVHISLLRSKIDRPFQTRSLRTVHHIGYKIVAES